MFCIKKCYLKLKKNEDMKKNILLLAILVVALASSCMEIKGRTIVKESMPKDLGIDSLDDITDAMYLSQVDDYVSFVRENIEEMNIQKDNSNHESKVLFIYKNDTIKLSVLADSANAPTTDIYFQNSTPIFINRSILLDVDSSYLETAYLRNGKIYKCFRNGMEIKDVNYINNFAQTIVGR